MNQPMPNSSRVSPWSERGDRTTVLLCTLGLLLAAGLLCGLNLGIVALRDWDEGIVAQVAREIWVNSSSGEGFRAWLYPTFWGEPYFNKPTLVHGLIAIAYAVGGVNEWTARLPGATFTVLSVPLLYWLAREAFRRHLHALFAALVYLTSLPVMRHGRLAMLDGALLFFLIMTLGCVLRARHDRRFALGVGLGLGLICLTKGVMVAVLFGAIALVFLYWDTPRLLTSFYLWVGLGLGCLPALAWYGAQAVEYGALFFDKNLVDQSFSRVWQPFEGNQGPPWYYLLELLKYGFPWVLFLPLSLRYAWDNRTLGWAKLGLVWGGVYLVAVSLMSTKLPWYSLPLYPALALVVGAYIADLWKHGNHVGVVHQPVPYSRGWVWLFLGLAGFVMVAIAAFGILDPNHARDIQIILVCVGLTLAMTGGLVAQQNPQFITVLIWGVYLSLLLLMASPLWLWELNEAFPVKPVAALVRQHVPPKRIVHMSHPYNRPSLSFYSNHRVIPATQEKFRQLWQKKAPPYLLLDPKTLQELALDRTEPLGEAEGWMLVKRSNSA